MIRLQATRKRMMTQNDSRQAGFTIIELLIAMAIFVVILFTAVSVFLQVSKMYYKGVTISRTQEAARTIMDDITREIQFSSNRVVANTASNPRVYCIGSRRYSYFINTLKTDTPAIGQSRHGLQKDVITTAGGCPVPSLGADNVVVGAAEMMAEGTALTNLDITCSADFMTCDIFLRMTYGDPADDDIFETSGSNRVCRGGVTAAEYCTVVEMRTTVTRRIR